MSVVGDFNRDKVLKTINDKFNYLENQEVESKIDEVSVNEEKIIKIEKDDVIEVLKEVLSKDDVDEKYVRDFLKCNSIDKYSDKIDIDKILFIYKYGSKKAKKIAVDEKLRTI